MPKRETAPPRAQNCPDDAHATLFLFVLDLSWCLVGLSLGTFDAVELSDDFMRAERGNGSQGRPIGPG